MDWHNLHDNHPYKRSMMMAMGVGIVIRLAAMITAGVCLGSTWPQSIGIMCALWILMPAFEK